MLVNIWRVGVKRMGPDSFQWCPATRQGATGTNWSIGSSTWTWGRTSFLWGWWSPGTGCPERLWSLLLWRYSRPVWTRSCAACSGWPTPTIVWFCDSVNYLQSSHWSFVLCSEPRLLPQKWIRTNSCHVRQTQYK